MVCFINHLENIIIFGICYLCYLFGFAVFMNGLISPTVVNLQPVPMALLLKECSNAIERDLCTLQESLYQKHYTNHRSKLILIVIDALRADFIPSVKYSHKFNITMNFTDQLLTHGTAISFITQGFAPTVTLPRIKTLVTGTISNFLDVIINFNAVKLTDDNILRQASLFGLKSIFYGDDTWLKLFPDLFIRSEGTHSFFVSDFTEVDFNVSRHIKSELVNSDWNIMILHFLGIDHIGHSHSPFSEYLPKKLIEMDETIKLIYENLNHTEPDSLIIVCGDHGMTNSGSHGGVTQDEMLTPLVFIKTGDSKILPEKTLDVIDQVDFAPTVSAVLGLPIPANNFGKIIPEVLEFIGFSSKETLFASYYNILQLLKVYRKVFSREPNVDLVKKTTTSHLNWLKSSDKTNFMLNNTDYMHILKSYNTLLNDMKQDLLNTISGYNEFSMILGIILMWISFAFSFYFLCPVNIDKINILKLCFKKITKLSFIVFFIIIAFFIYYKIYREIILINLCIVLFFVCQMVFLLLKRAKETYFVKFIWKICLFFLSVHALSLFSSSYIEEEHQTWYFLSSTIIILLCSRRLYNFSNLYLKNTGSGYNLCLLWTKYSTFIYAMSVLLILHRISRKWNQVGNKWQHLPDISDWLNQKENVAFMGLAIVISQIIILIYFRKKLKCLNYILFCLGIVCISSQKLENITNYLLFTDYTISVILPWIVYVLITLLTILIFIQSYSCIFVSNTVKAQHFLINFVSQWILLIEIVGRAYNIPLITIVLLEEHLLSKIVWAEDFDLITNVICYLIMATTSFFYYGNSNSLSTIDVFTGYTGIQSYMPFIVSLLIICNTYSTVLLWLIMLPYRMLKFYNNEDFKTVVNRIKLVILLLLDYKLFVLALYCVVMYLMRHHLFIYSVFFPKLFYELCHVMLFCIIYFLVSFIVQ